MYDIESMQMLQKCLAKYFVHTDYVIMHTSSLFQRSIVYYFCYDSPFKLNSFSSYFRIYSACLAGNKPLADSIPSLSFSTSRRFSSSTSSSFPKASVSSSSNSLCNWRLS